MFYQKGIPLAVSAFQVRHQVSKDSVMEWINHDGIYSYEEVDAYFLDSLLFFNGEYIHTLDRYRLELGQVDHFKDDLLKEKPVLGLMDHKTKPSILQCYFILLTHNLKKKFA